MRTISLVNTVNRALGAGVIVLLGLSGCGGAAERTSGGKSRPAAQSGNTFQAAGIPFTFRFPHGLQQVRARDDQNIPVVTPTPADLGNGLKIRVTSARELPFASYAARVRAQFQQQLLTRVSQREERHGALELGVLEWSKASTYTDLGTEKTLRQYSTSYFFVGGGKTWQLECLATQEYRAVIGRACQQALTTIKFSGRT